MKRPEYIGIPIKHISQTIIDKYKLEKYGVDKIVYFEVTKGMYGLPQAEKQANNQLIKFLQLHRYKNSPSHQDCGDTTHATSRSAWLWTISPSSTPISMTSIISTTF